jgi:hypothetical protein
VVNCRNDTEGKAAHQAETKRLALLNLPDPDDAFYNFRTTVERINAQLKDELGGRFLRVRGLAKGALPSHVRIARPHR